VMAAKDGKVLRQNSPVASGEAGQLSKVQAAPPAPPKMGLGAERRDQGLETASAAPAAEGSPAQVQSLRLNGRNATDLTTDELKQQRGAGQGIGSTAGAAAISGGLIRPTPKTEQETSSTAGAAGEAQAKAENAPAPAPPPPARTTAEAEPRSVPGGFNATTESSARLFKKAEQPSQTQEGTLKGVVRDPSGAAVSRATVIVTNTRTSEAKPFTTNAAGEYVAANLTPGEYKVEASAQGFEPSSKSIPLLARADHQLDFTLGVGTSTQTITVEAASHVLQTASPQWRVGPHGLIQKRIGEDEWQTKSSGVAEDLYAISFASHEVGWAVGQDGTVLRSANGGESWGRLASPTSEVLVRVRATSAESAEVTTRSGIVFRTTDGAATWTRVEANP
jgi:Carboxypeptidase regulatory-like domain/Photosynthesis system II assembly factor YCF48